MPAVTKYATFREMFVDTNTGKSFLDRTVTRTLSQTVKPTTLPRSKPKDLFGSGTPRQSSHSHVNHGSSTASGSGFRFTGISLAHSVDYSGRRSLPTTVDFTIVDNKVRRQIRETYVNLPVALAESGQTMRMAAKAIANFREVYQKLRRLDPNLLVMPYYALREKRLRERWLEYRYGWNPLVMEVDAGMRALNARAARPIYTHGVSKETTTRGQSYTTNLVRSPYSFNRVGVDLSVRYYAQSRYRVSFDTNGIASRLSPFGLTNPLLVGWELIPFSFVADWFVNVGETLASLDNLHQVKELTVIRSSQVRSAYTLTGELNVSGNSLVIDRVWDRKIPSSMSLITKLAYSPSVSCTRLVDAIALLRQAQKGPHH